LRSDAAGRIDLAIRYPSPRNALASSPADVVVGLLTENTPRMLGQAIRLLRSIRWFGGELANVRVVVCGVEPLESGAHRSLEALGAEIRPAIGIN
jgi:hypothetical protein